MPDSQVQEVALKLTVDADQGKKGLNALAEATRNTAKEAKTAQTALDGLGETARRLQHNPSSPKPPPLPFHARHEAMQAMERERRARDVERERVNLAYNDWKHTPALQRSLLPPGVAAAGINPMLAAGGAIYTGGRLVATANGIMTEHGNLAAQRLAMGEGGVSEAETARLAANKMMALIPGLDTLRTNFERLSGTAQQAQLAIAGLAAQDRLVDRSVNATGLAGEQSRSIYGIRMSMVDASAQARASRDFADSLTPATLARYRGPFGEAQAEVDRAALAARATRESLAHRDAMLPGAFEANAKASRDAHNLGAAADAAQRRAREAERALKGQLGRWDAGPLHPDVIAAKNHATQALSDAESAAKQSQMADKNAAEKSLNLEQQINGVKSDRIKLAQEELAHQRAILTVNTQIAQGAQGRAMRYGVGSPGQAFQDEQILRMIQANGVEAVSPEMRQRALAIPGAADILGPQIREFGDRQGAGVREVLANMAPADQRDQIRKPLADQQDAIQTRRAEANAEADRQIAAATEQAGGNMANLIADKFQLMEAAFERQIESRLANQKMLNPN